MTWTHSMCCDCWDDRHPDALCDRARAGTLGYCCLCGKLNRHEIYFRMDHKLCKGDHGPISSNEDVQAYLRKEREERDDMSDELKEDIQFLNGRGIIICRRGKEKSKPLSDETISAIAAAVRAVDSIKKCSYCGEVHEDRFCDR